LEEYKLQKIYRQNTAYSLTENHIENNKVSRIKFWVAAKT